MRRRRTRGAENQVSLFPFLAVLICTMGVLIVLLVLVAKNADRVAKASQDEAEIATTEELDELQFQVESAQFRSAELESFRPQLVADLQQQKERRSHLEDHQRELIRRLEELREQWRSIKDSASEPSATDQLALDAIQADIETLRRQLTQVRDETERRKSRTAVVAYDGRSGTQRRPIYIECLPEGIRLQPYEIMLTADDFVRPIMPGNPLDAAILAIRERWSQQDPSQSQGAPYPLILVRPGGSMSYAIVRDAMKSWDSEFGHQIVPQKLELDYPYQDPGMQEQLAAVIETAKRRQDRIQRSANAMAGRMAGGNGLGGAGFGSSRGDAQQGGIGVPGGRQAGSSLESPPVVLRASGRRGGFVAEGGPSNFRGLSPGSNNRSSSNSQRGSETQSSNGGGRDLAAQPVGSRSTGSNNGTSPGGGSAASGMRSNTGIAIPSSSTSQGTSNQAPSMADARGENWALPTQTAGGTAFRRPIRVSITADRIVVHGNSTERRRDRTFIFDPTVSSAMDPMVEAIWERIDSWGVAGFNSYWKPELNVQVYPGGETSFQEMKQLLKDSGLGVSEVSP